MRRKNDYISKVNVNDLVLLVHLQLSVKMVLREICNGCNYKHVAKCMTMNIVLHISYYGWHYTYR